MDALAQIDTIIEILTRFGVEIRHERLGGDGGGLCRMRGRNVMFIDDDADPATRLERCVAGLAALPQADAVFLPSDLRELVDVAKKQAS